MTTDVTNQILDISLGLLDHPLFLIVMWLRPYSYIPFTVNHDESKLVVRHVSWMVMIQAWTQVCSLHFHVGFQSFSYFCIFWMYNFSFLESPHVDKHEIINVQMRPLIKCLGGEQLAGRQVHAGGYEESYKIHVPVPVARPTRGSRTLLVLLQLTICLLKL